MALRAFLGLDPKDDDYPALGVEAATPPPAEPVPPSAYKVEAAIATLEHHGFTYQEGQRYWTAPLGKLDRQTKALANLIATKRAKEKREAAVTSDEYARRDAIYQNMRRSAWAEAEAAMVEFCSGRPAE